MRNFLFLVLGCVAVLMAAGPPAQAAQVQEQVVFRQIGAGYFDIWLHADGVTWQDTDKDGNPDSKGQTGKKYRAEFTIPANKLAGYELTRIEVSHQFGQAEYEDPKTYSPKAWGESWTHFVKTRLWHQADNLLAQALAPDLVMGRVTAEWSFDLAPEDRAYDLKGEHAAAGEQFANAVEGWRWYLPVMATWYGVPKATPDFAVQLHQHEFKDRQPGQKITSQVTYKLHPGHLQAEKAQLELTHVVGGVKYPVLPIHGQVREFQPGEEFTFDYNVTVQSKNSIVEAKIIPLGPDANWSNNRDEAKVRIVLPQAGTVNSPSGSGVLSFQAVSQGGIGPDGQPRPATTRKLNTARWQDKVTATLQPPAPVVTGDSAELLSWKIDWAKLTYPKIHPNFTFGSPVEPVETVTVNMTSGGWISTIEFYQNWSVNGADIYDRLKGQKVPGPTDYTLSAQYKVSYQYRYKVWFKVWYDYDCGTPEEPATCSDYYWDWQWQYAAGEYTKTVTQDLLVDGVGKVPVAM